MPKLSVIFSRVLFAAALVTSGLAAAQTLTAPEPGKTYRIGFAQIVDHPALNATRQGFIDGLKAAGFEEGKNLVIDYQNAQGNPGAGHNIIDKFITDQVDLIAACTTPIGQAAIGQTKGTTIPVVFGCVTNPVQTGILTEAGKATGTNVTGIYTVPPVKPNFDLFLAIAPKVKTIGTIWNSGETNSEALNKLAQAEAERRGLSWVPVTITSSAEVKNAAESLIGKVDAIITPQDNTVASAYDGLVKVARDAGIPWFSFDVLAVDHGAVASLAQHQYKIGQDWAAKIAVPVLLGQDPGTIVPIEAQVFELHVNAGAAKAAGLTIPDDILKQAAKVVP